MRTSIRAIVVMLLGLCITTNGAAQTEPAFVDSGLDAQTAAGVERGRLIMRELLQKIGVPGMAVAVGVEGDVVWSEGFGFADLELSVPATRLTRFRVGSVSKPITAAALGLLVERGQLDLDAPVQRYVPTFPEKRWPVTSRALAGHLSGVRHYLGRETYSSRRYDTVLEGLSIFQDDTLLFEPGTRFSYSSYAWNLLSAVVEGASSERFLPFMDANVFRPIGLRHIVADHTDSLVPNRTRFYARTREGGVLNAPYVDNSYKWAGGGFLSTAEDLVRFGMAHVQPGLLQPETLELLWTSQRTNDGEPTNYGIGWAVGTDHHGRRVVHHGGGSVGGRAFLLLFPEDGVVVAILANSSAPMTFGTAWTIAEPFLPPTASDLSYVDHSGTYDCTYTSGRGEERSATLNVIGSPDSYLLRVTTDDSTSDAILAWGQGRELRAIALEDDFWVRNLWLTVAGERASGHWDTTAVTCDVR
jgi:CubicO group peptidase (beta-lactamase class C family)